MPSRAWSTAAQHSREADDSAHARVQQQTAQGLDQLIDLARVRTWARTSQLESGSNPDNTGSRQARPGRAKPNQVRKVLTKRVGPVQSLSVIVDLIQLLLLVGLLGRVRWNSTVRTSKEFKSNFGIQKP